jgi:pyruvate dehydrogenase E2 component (dihydrolipoamide acetyltransferase)
MAIEITMPALSPTMEKGTLAKWLVRLGDSVKPGDVLAEIETDKATMEFEAVDEGVVTQIIVPDYSEDIPVGAVLALIEMNADALPAPVIAETAVAPALVQGRPDAAIPLPEPEPSVPVGVLSHKAVTPIALDGSVNATPLAKRIAAIRDIALAGITGSGPRGKIVTADLGLRPLADPLAAVSVAAPVEAIAPPPEGVPVETVKLSGMRKTIARRLTESKQTVPHFYLTARCNLDPVLRLRGELNAELVGRGVKLSVNDMLMKALALALRQVPDANVQFGGDVLHRFGRVDIAMAVAIDGGLITPVIKGVDMLSLSAIAQRAKELAGKAREGRLAPEEYQGGTCSLSNLGMFGIDEMFPVINPPQALILGTAAGISQPWNVGGEIQLATIMAATASFDHRAIDGAVAAEFMKVFRELVETPMHLLV